ncbi:Histamine H3 receptor-like [Phytophthora palmivora]|uniref:Histamine H3 receptor-like n=1 Tax=Phytophthora palmivora TaxID=4796 RepID=A0A2P4XFI0_9STRA|nr:Histamine H3 receptor-like [Phytophthora palmivora]
MRTSVANAQEITNVLSDIVAEHAAARPSNTLDLGNMPGNDLPPICFSFDRARPPKFTLSPPVKTNNHPHRRRKASHDIFDTLKRKQAERKKKSTCVNFVIFGGPKIVSSRFVIVQIFFYTMRCLPGARVTDLSSFSYVMLTLELLDEGPQLCTPLVIIMN